MPRPSIGETPMTGAERQACYRAASAVGHQSSVRVVLSTVGHEPRDGATLSGHLPICSKLHASKKIAPNHMVMVGETHWRIP
jgi:hypothetical protein